MRPLHTWFLPLGRASGAHPGLWLRRRAAWPALVVAVVAAWLVPLWYLAGPDLHP